MRKTLTRYAVPPRFLDVLFGVSGNTKYSEEGYGAAVFSMAGESSGLCGKLAVENWRLPILTSINRHQLSIQVCGEK